MAEEKIKKKKAKLERENVQKALGNQGSGASRFIGFGGFYCQS